MKFFINSKELNEGISTVIKAVSVRTTMGILEGVYIEARDNALLLKCSDLSLQIETVIPATVEEEGKIVLPGRIFSEIIKKVPGEMTEIYTEEKTAFIESGRIKTSLQGMNADDFPYMSEFTSKTEFSISHKTFKNMIKQTIFAIAQDETKPILTGICFEFKENGLSMVALDGYRLAIRNETLDKNFEETTIVVPGRALSEISKLLADTGDLIDISFSATHLKITIGETTTITRLMDGEFIKYKHIITDTHTTRARVNRTEMQDSIERASLIAREGKANIVKLSFTPDKLFVSANSELGKSNEDINISTIGNDLEIAFNAKFMNDVLRFLDDEYIYLDMNNSISPCMIRPIQGSEYFYLILPVRHFSGS